VLLPRPRRLAELVAELGAVGILGLPSHEPRPVGEQRLVDDLDSPRRFFVLFSVLVGGEEAGVDQLAEDLFG